MTDRTPGSSFSASPRTSARWSVRYRISPANPRSTQLRNRSKSGTGCGAVTPTSSNPHVFATSWTRRLFTDFVRLLDHNTVNSHVPQPGCQAAFLHFASRRGRRVGSLDRGRPERVGARLLRPGRAHSVWQ